MFEHPFAPCNILGPGNKIDETLAREAILRLARLLVGGASGRSLGDEIFELVTEGRQAETPSYDDAHVDLIQCVAWSMLGAGTAPLGPVRKNLARQVINREEAFGWERSPAGEISRLRESAAEHFQAILPHVVNIRPPKPGDVAFLGHPASQRVAIIEEIFEKDILLLSYQTAQKKIVSSRAVQTISRHQGRPWVSCPPYPDLPFAGYLNLVSWLQSVIDASNEPLDELIARGA